MLRNRMIALLAGVMVLSIAGAALAAPSPDTLLVQGYDADEMRLVFGVSDIENGTLDCKLTGAFVYELDGDDVASLHANTGNNEDPTEGSEVEFGTENQPFTTKLKYTTPDAMECRLTSVDVTGPNGQVNHGTVQSAFVHALKAMGLKGMGCLTSKLSQLGYGKGDQQIKVSDVVEPEVPADLLSVDLDWLEAACNKKAEDWEPPGQAKKGDGWVNPGQLKKAEKAHNNDD